MSVPAIVTIGYNRVESLSRLLCSLGQAHYPADVSVPLIISIDKSDSSEVVDLAEGFEWTHGEKQVIARDKRMGLKNHVLACGDLSRQYGSIIVLEDDLFVSPDFYIYSQKALDFAEGDERIGSISLYNHLFNVHVRRSFAAIDDGYDNWYFQMSSSWGQAYTASQWEGFRQWYELHKDEAISGSDIPDNIAGWSEKSWLKYFITYLVRSGKYCLYPRKGYTTNFGDVGSHAKKADTDLQVALSLSKKPLDFDFSRLDESGAVYDAFFENEALKEAVIRQLRMFAGSDGAQQALDEEDGKNILIDLYDVKNIEEILKCNSNIRYILSSKRLGLRVVKSYARQLRPVDANILCDISGDDFYLYDRDIKADAPTAKSEAEEYLYEYRGISAKQMLKIIMYRICEKL